MQHMNIRLAWSVVRRRVWQQEKGEHKSSLGRIITTNFTRLNVHAHSAEQGDCSRTGEEGGEERDAELLGGGLGEAER